MDRKQSIPLAHCSVESGPNFLETDEIANQPEPNNRSAKVARATSTLFCFYLPVQLANTVRLFGRKGFLSSWVGSTMHLFPDTGVCFAARKYHY